MKNINIIIFSIVVILLLIGIFFILNSQKIGDDGNHNSDSTADNKDSENTNLDKNGSIENVSSNVIVTTDISKYKIGDTATITIENKGAEKIFISNCNQFAVEIKKENKWEVKKLVPDVDCFEEGIMIVEPKTSFRREYKTDSLGIFRASSMYGMGCEEGKSFGSCKNTETLYSKEFKVSLI